MNLAHLFVTTIAVLTAACSSAPSPPSRPASAATATSVGTPAAGPAGSTGPLFSAFEYGPYLAAAPGAAYVGHEYAVEYGYVDMRRSAAGADPFDFRQRSVTGLAVDGSLPAGGTGCNSVTPASGAATASALRIAGPASTTLSFDASGFARDEDTDGSNPIDTTKTLAADFLQSGGAAAAHLDGTTLPTPGVIQLAGAFAQDISVDTVIPDITNALQGTTDDLVIADYGDAKNYDTVVVLFFGGAAATTKVVRCVIAPKQSVTMTSAVYKGLLPLKGIAGLFANASVTQSDGNSVWGGAVAGAGSEDTTVP